MAEPCQKLFKNPSKSCLRRSVCFRPTVDLGTSFLSGEPQPLRPLPAMPPPSPHPQDAVVLLLKTNFMLPKKQTPTPRARADLGSCGLGIRAGHTHWPRGSGAGKSARSGRAEAARAGPGSTPAAARLSGDPNANCSTSPALAAPRAGFPPSRLLPSPFRPSKDSLRRSQVTC